MKKQIKKIDATKMEVHIEAGADVVAGKFNEVYEKISKEAKVKGFRPGKVPRDILEKHYSSHAHQQVVNELVPDLLKKAADEDKINIVSVLNVSDVNLSGANISFKADVEVEPEVKLGEYKGIKVKWEEVKIGKDDVKRYIEALKEKGGLEVPGEGLARALGYPSNEQMEESVRMQLYLQKENQIRSGIEQKIIDELLKSSSLSVPQSLLARRLDELASDAKMQLAMRGFTKEQIEGKDEDLKKELKANAETQVKIYLIFKSIAQKENITVDNQVTQKVMEFLLKAADWDVPSRIIT
ncbi:MAG: trigger factor [Candidatus Omnitrophica bacterium]|nr:trigger factor [Candidatus Omnitrophota bacterium]